ncbi:hypothetical protein BH11BAC6_BH11BAC6_14190 [soil metagenome]
MLPKDYYTVLGIKHTASTEEIKRSYRRLAHKYHPDKNPGDIISENVFTNIAEAYRVLSDVKERAIYNAKRFYNYSEQHETTTVETILRDALKLKQLTERADPFRLNQDALLQQVETILSAHNIALLQHEKQNTINTQVAEAVLAACYLLDFHPYCKVHTKLIELSPTNNLLKEKILVFYTAKQKTDKWNRYKVVLAVLLAVLLCVIIFIIGSRR